MAINKPKMAKAKHEVSLHAPRAGMHYSNKSQAAPGVKKMKMAKAKMPKVVKKSSHVSKSDYD